ncbi:MAG: metallophosphoesterase, partial [Candidatus Marinimicrobia bacterium]|nr:metallophosphoesterase [Candidatus Neomarinimicrobiota bacterium]
TIGEGSIDKNPEQDSYYYDNTVELTATPEIGWVFDHWEGATGNTNPKYITIKRNRNITAVFVNIPYTINTTTIGEGSIDKNPEQDSYYYDNTVELTATPEIGWVFDHWEGDLTGNANPEDITIDGNKNITAVFNENDIKFANIGDYGLAGINEAQVAQLIKRQGVDVIITTGDNNYPVGAASTIDANVGQYYSEYIGNYKGSYGVGSPTNRFYPIPGNHDHNSTLQPYLDYFSLTAIDGYSYYDFIKAGIHFFCLDTKYAGIDNKQMQCFTEAVNNSTAKLKVAVIHYCPYSSGSTHGSITEVQLPFKELGIKLVLSGHDHLYERLEINDVTYIVNGIGGGPRYGFGTPIQGSKFRYNATYGAVFMEGNADKLELKFIDVNNQLIDNCIIMPN